MAEGYSMDTKCKRRCYKASTILGSIFIMMPNGVFIYWGNIAVYVLSFVVFELKSPPSIEAPWIVSLYIAFWMLGLLVYCLISSIIGYRWTAVSGILLTDLGIALCYFAVKYSFFLLNATLGVMTGLGTGLTQGYALSVLVRWAEKDVGFTVSFCQGAFYWGAMIINQFMTFYINPMNIAPDTKLGEHVYFSYRDVLNKVPSSFLVLLCFSVSTHWLGFLLMKENNFDKPSKDPRQNSSDYRTVGDNGGCYGSNVTDTTIGEGSYSTTAHHKRVSTSLTVGRPNPESEKKDYSPKEMLRTTVFYSLWVTYFFAELPFLLLLNYYKSFAQLWIPDDHFLTDLGTVMAFINIWMRIVWGITMDKIGVKNCLTLEVASVVLLSVWFYFTPMVNQWLYAVVCCMFMGLSGALYNACINVVVVIFGKKHFSTNLGLLRSSAIILNVLSIFGIDAVLRTFGWFYTFASSGFLNIFSLVLVLKFVPRRKDNVNER